MSNKLLLIDGNSIINRAFYGVPDLTNQDGVHTNAIYGFINILLKTIDEENPTHLLIAFDEKAKTFRHKMFEEYKGTRKPMPNELREQVPLLKELLQAMNICIYSKEGIEADDILGTMAKNGEQEGYQVVVLSGDRDLLQLSTDNILIRIPKTKAGKTITENYYPQNVFEKFGVTPLQIIDLKGLMGDSSDNIPGVPGIGEKTAVKLLSVYATVENTIKNIDNITGKKVKETLKNNVNLAKLSKELATIKTDCKLAVKLEDCVLSDIFTKKAYKIIQKLDIKSLLKRFKEDFSKDSMLEKSFAVVNTLQELKAFFAELKAQPIGLKLVSHSNDEVSVDMDGQMTLLMPDSTDGIFGCAFSYDKDKVCFAKISSDFYEEDLLNEIKELSKKHVIVCNDVKSQLDFLGFLCPNEKSCFDTQIAAYLLNPVQKSFLEEDIAEHYAYVSMPCYDQLFGKADYYSAYEKNMDELIRYISYCAYVNYLSYESLKKELKKEKEYELYKDVELPLAFTLYSMEKNGILVKRDALKEYSDMLSIRITELETKIYDRAGEEFNINSPKQLGVVLFEKMNMPYGKKTKTGYSTSAEVLEKLRFEDPIVEDILEYRQLTKLKSTYADGLINYIDASDGRIHTTFNQTITATGRLSSTEPNLQNIPIRMELGRQIRKVFIPQKDYVFLDADYSQIELRVLAHMSEDEKLIKAYKENADIHRATASVVFNTDYDKVTSLQRRNAKAVNFGIVYGISGFGLSRDLNITKKEASKYIDDYFLTYPNVKKYMDERVSEAKEKGCVYSLFGRKRPIPEIQSKNFMQRQFGERIAMNSPIQGTAADIIKIAMINVDKRLKDANLKSRLILQIHDELIIETHVSEIDLVKTILHDEMVNACELSVPLIAEVEQGDTWFDAH